MVNGRVLTKLVRKSKSRGFRSLTEYLSVFTAGSGLYGLTEILWRGYTHWTMLIVGGLCFLFIYIHELFACTKNIFRRCLAGAAIITAVEFVSGCIINLYLKWEVWDYSNLKPHLFGQVCLLYSVLWFFLCLPICFLCKFFRDKFHS